MRPRSHYQDKPREVKTLISQTGVLALSFES
jgi:hypothetical protein